MASDIGNIHIKHHTDIVTLDMMSAVEPYWSQTVTKDDIPIWLQDNDFILNGYPMPTGSYKRSFRLWHCLHMETMNIWTHMLGTIAVSVTGVALGTVVVSKYLYLTTGDKFAFGVFIAAATLS